MISPMPMPTPTPPLSEARAQTLLRRFEPVLRFTRGEKFFPMDVAPYVRQASLWVHHPGQPSELLVADRDLTLERLAETQRLGFDAVHYLKFIDPLNLPELAAYQIEQLKDGLDPARKQDRFRAGLGRLARVGYVSRLVDAVFSITLLARGRVPGDTAAAAEIAYHQLMAEHEHYRYYGRVVCQNSWIVLQYWYFYAFNDWRSGFSGVNDHEADWEMVCVYLWEDEDEVHPEWVAYAAHDFSGDDLRRRWDDPEVDKVGEHPVVYVGAGSHASYFAAGEYITELKIPWLAPLQNVLESVVDFWWRWLRQEPRPASTNIDVFHIPFVDYARGDGFSLGAEQQREWDEPELVSHPPDWVMHYRGLWGLYARDPISGENAPAGPRYNRGGTVRLAWYDPLGWAGLDKVAPPCTRLATLQARRAEMATRQQTLIDTIKARSAELYTLGMEIVSLQGHPHLAARHQDRQSELEARSREIRELRAEFAENKALLAALDHHITRVRAGEREPARAHIRHEHLPMSEKDLRLGRVAEIWAATSIGILMLAVVGLVIFARDYWGWGLLSLALFMIVVEASFRRRLMAFTNAVAVCLAIIAVGVLLYEFFGAILLLIILGIGAYIIVENLRELWY